MPTVRLMREVRFSIDRDWAAAAHGAEGFERAHPITNSWGGWPSAVGIAPYLVLRAVVEGRPDPVTGYLVNIRELDVLLREQGIPLAAQHLRERGVRTTGETLLRAIWTATTAQVPAGATMRALELRPTPTLRYELRAGATDMIRMTQSFEFSAAHRLHVPALSEEENRRFFGKCNNPNGHGHNYLVEVTIEGRPDPATGCLLPLPRLEQIVKERVIDRLDHTHLNRDTREFASLNPSVENIAIVVWGLLDGQFDGARLDCVRVWETPKTYAEYRGEKPAM